MQLPLWRLLQSVAAVVGASMEGDSWAVSQVRLNPDERPAVQAMAFQVWRNWGRAQAIRKLLAPKKPPAEVDALLGSSLALIWNPQTAPYAAHTLVSQAVEAAKQQAATAGQAAFINAVLRRFLREQPALIDATQSDPVAVFNHPAWWLKRLRVEHPKHWEQIAFENNNAGPLTVRFSEAFKPLVSDSIEVDATVLGSWQQVGRQAFIARPARPVHLMSGFSQGHFSVQDAAAQLAAPLLLDGLDASLPLRILDACAAPGGKTTHLLELAPNAHVTALDVSAARLGRILDNLRRVGQTDARRVSVLVGDAGEPEAWWTGEQFDAILIDAPCTASGIVRRQPDVRWLRREADLVQLVVTQKRLLNSLWPLLKPGGQLVFCTCSVFQAEGEGQVAAFQSRNSDAKRLDAPGQLLPRSAPIVEVFKDNPPGDHDGFFYARFVKVAPLA